MKGGADKGTWPRPDRLAPVVRHCVTRALASGDTQEAETKTNELLEAVQRFAKTR